MIKEITFEQILPIWRDYLWPERTTDITATSAMSYMEGYDLVNMSYPPTFFAYYVNDVIAGVNSGHMCMNGRYRSRGLYVFDKFRGMGIGTKLLIATIDQARLEGANLCWSYPRDSSWSAYAKAGFELSSEFVLDENGKNAYCVILL
mgnify:CR=1 FL=1